MNISSIENQVSDSGVTAERMAAGNPGRATEETVRPFDGADSALPVSQNLTCGQG